MKLHLVHLMLTNPMKTKKEQPKKPNEIENKNEADKKSLSDNQITALKVIAVTCGILSFILFLVVIGLGVLHGSIPVCNGGYTAIPRNFDQPGVFDDLTPQEYVNVKDFLLSDSTLNLVPFENATLNSSYIYMIDLLMPLKDAVLRHLDRGDKQPERTAKVVLYRGNRDPPTVEEILVGPLPKPEYFRRVSNPSYTTNKIPFTSRPVDDIEYHTLYSMLSKVTEIIYPILRESYGLSYHNCTKGVDCMLFFDIAPRGTESGQRKSWFWSFRDVEGFYLHPLGLEIQIDHKSVNTDDWKVTKLVYNGQLFYTAEDLLKVYREDRGIKKIKLSPVGYKEHLYSSYIRRGDRLSDPPLQGPKLVEPDGHRYQVTGSHVKYMNWDFNIRSRTSSGIQIFDVRFQEERIVYELSLQDAAVFYSGFGPTQTTSVYYDNSWLMGSMNFALVPGIDCPDTATFLDAFHFVNAGIYKHIKNSICIFENNANLPLRRHYSNNFAGGYSVYGGLAGHSLIVRTITNIWNYDYIFDYIFHLNGAIEIQVSATGYVQSTFALPGELKYGNLMNKKVMADIHQHLFHYKVDIDVNGPENRYTTLDITTEHVRNPWYRDVNKTQMKFESFDKRTEMESVTQDISIPKYDIIYNSKATSKFGANRAYRILNYAKTKFLVEDASFAKSGLWAKYPIAVTQFQRHRGDEHFNLCSK
ncbi:hypothetical protein KUTeg_005031 [Tegillarca granosa]|uniref:Amine oxidase n=1 Tax=Tegillarca granosa TaxID=220873 RepID=A0ABQ9FMF4_TEGGR|nr:hypothetical protein KUTeg_005031 [Tegillarca granosa]